MFIPLPDNRPYLNLMSSAELVNFQQQMFAVFHTAAANLNPRTYMNEVQKLLYQREAGTISSDQLNAALDVYRNTDNRSQIIDNFLRKETLIQQHNIAFRGGSDKYTYSISGNYTQTLPFENYQQTNTEGFNFKNTFTALPWLKIDAGLIGRYSSSNQPTNVPLTNYQAPFSPQSVLIGSRASYLGLRDQNGNLTNWSGISKQEDNRLTGLGLYSENYNPITDKDQTFYQSSSTYNNINLDLNIRLIDGLTFVPALQIEKSFANNGYFLSKDSYSQRLTINNATQIAPTTGNATYLIPQGGARTDQRTELNAYTLRAQLNYNKTIGYHAFTAIAGAEQRDVKSDTYTSSVWGYDNTSLANKYINEALLGTVQTGTQSLDGAYVYTSTQPYTERENRFVSFYANASYEFNDKYLLSSSIRMDQSNLFGTDPSLQYRPLWSTGVKWNLNKENFLKDVSWLNRLSLRATYGINGNVPTQSGPYLIVASTGVNGFNGQFSSKIVSPPNSALRWEKTRQKDIGLDFSIFNDRLNVVIDYYDKETSDLLGTIATDPTSGWTSLNLNYANMFNRGYEVSLTSRNFQSRAFQWSTNLNFAYNQNKVTNLQTTATSVVDYLELNTREGIPLSSLYSVRYAGLDNTGKPLAYKADGTKVSSLANLTVADLVYSGTTVPPYSGALTNSFAYKNLSLSFMFVFYAGGVARDVMPNYITNTETFNTNVNRNVMNYWQKPGDENDPNKSPAILRYASTNITYLWYGADKFVKSTSYAKLRDLTFGYQFSQQWVKKIGLSRLNLQCQVQNLFYIAANKEGLDPEGWLGLSVANSIRQPQLPKTYTIGLAASF